MEELGAIDNWADVDSEEDEFGGGDEYDDRDWPKRPPYAAFVGGIAPQTLRDHLGRMFKELKVTDIIMHQPTKRDEPPKWAYVFFQSLDDLKKAISMNGTNLLGRTVSIDIGQDVDKIKRSSKTRYNGSFTRGRDIPISSSSSSSPSMNSRAPPSRDLRSSYNNNNNNSNYRNSPRDFSNTRERGSSQDFRSQGRRDMNERRPYIPSSSSGSGDRRRNDMGRSSYESRGRSDSYGKGWSNRRDGQSRSYNRRNDTPTRTTTDSFSPSTHLSSTTTPSSSTTTTDTSSASRRPRLKLLPRTKPVATSETSDIPSRSSIFGDAKPRDESKFLKKKEEEKKQQPPLPTPSSPGRPMSSKTTSSSSPRPAVKILKRPPSSKSRSRSDSSSEDKSRKTKGNGTTQPTKQQTSSHGTKSASSKKILRRPRTKSKEQQGKKSSNVRATSSSSSDKKDSSEGKFVTQRKRGGGSRGGHRGSRGGHRGGRGGTRGGKDRRDRKKGDRRVKKGKDSKTNNQKSEKSTSKNGADKTKVTKTKTKFVKKSIPASKPAEKKFKNAFAALNLDDSDSD